MDMDANDEVVSAKAGLRSKSSRMAFAPCGGRSHNHPVRFWIITMMLVLIGLSTLKLR
jgi:UDP-N-acetylmuramyl pentapeptide phosphotransferase/UDP-N-acetylglucosamine-1-phosphate transferase